MNTKQTAYSILDLVLVPKELNLQNTYQNTLKLATEAEKSGYKRFWLAEHHNSINIGSSATSILIGYVAAGTKSIRVGSGGVMLPNHSPLIIAEQFGTLGTMYPNRIDLGLGRAPGTDQETALAIRSDFMLAAHSFPDEVQKIENYFSINNKQSKIRATVAEGVDVPIYILGSSTESAHLAAKKGLPYAFAGHFAPEKLEEAFEVYRNEFKPSNALQKPYTIAGINVIIGDTDEEAEFLATSFISMFIDLITGQKNYFRKPFAIDNKTKAMFQHPALNRILKYAFIGSKETVAQQVKEFILKTNTDELIVASNIYDSQQRIASYKIFAEIMKELNKE